ncbi:MAG: hypothetical protein BZ136_09265 [Methanosphaera sp. rholeuAM74]|nr:MAG: hypothetical protein BZ136_09265 [Methanosphaera sp. rholeuAM74]
MIVPVLDQKGRRTGEYAQLVCNVTSSGPSYMNQGGELGLTRTRSGVLVVVYSNLAYMGSSFAEEISEADAYKLCMKNQHTTLIDELGLDPEEECVFI